MKNKILFIVLIIFLGSCAKQEKEEFNFIFIGHSYQWHQKYTIDKRLEKIDYSNYDEVWLGGDLCSEIIPGSNTLLHIDSLFNIKSENTYWSLGNHDTRKGAIHEIENFTQKDTYYAKYKNGITRLVLNTNFNNKQVEVLKNNCEELEKQYNLIKNVTDTIKDSEYLIMLIHGSAWEDVENDIPKFQANLRQKDYLFTCDSNSTFKNKIYPLFVNARERGVKVVLISGDYGQKSKSFEYTTKDDIVFLGSGINNSILDKPESTQYYSYVTNFDPDQILTFKYNTKEKKLTWEFVVLNDFIKEDDK